VQTKNKKKTKKKKEKRRRMDGWTHGWMEALSDEILDGNGQS